MAATLTKALTCRFREALSYVVQPPQHRLYFLPLPQGQGALRLIAGEVDGARCLLFACAERRSIIFAAIS